MVSSVVICGAPVLPRLSWSLPEGMDVEGRELLLFPAPKAASQSLGGRCPGWNHEEKELRWRGITRVLGVGRVSCRQSRRLWLYLVLHDLRGLERVCADDAPGTPGGEKVFVDFAGDNIDIIDPITGEADPMKLFVAAMGASNYTYASPPGPCARDPAAAQTAPSAQRAKRPGLFGKALCRSHTTRRSAISRVHRSRCP